MNGITGGRVVEFWRLNKLSSPRNEGFGLLSLSATIRRQAANEGKIMMLIVRAGCLSASLVPSDDGSKRLPCVTGLRSPPHKPPTTGFPLPPSFAIQCAHHARHNLLSTICGEFDVYITVRSIPLSVTPPSSFPTPNPIHLPPSNTKTTGSIPCPPH